MQQSCNSDLVNRLDENYNIFKQQLKESFVEWQDQVAEEHKEHAAEVEQIVVVPMGKKGFFPKQISLLPLHAQPLIANPRFILPQAKTISSPRPHLT